MDTDALRLARSLREQARPERLGWGAVDLSVTSLDRAVAFWTGALGFRSRPGNAPGTALGTAHQTLVVLHEGAIMPVQRGHAGMYHAAFGVPSQAEFSRLLARFTGLGLQVSPVDHTMSKAIYLSDPDGHGIEIAFETPERFGRFTESARGLVMIDHRGQPRGLSTPLDMTVEMTLAQGGDLTAPIADGTVISHLHLHVPDLQAGVDWFEGVGFARNLMLPALGMADMGAGAACTHRLALNVWAGKSVPPAPFHSARLLGYRLVTTDPAVWGRARVLLGPSAAGALSGWDPAGINLTLTYQQAVQRLQGGA